MQKITFALFTFCLFACHADDVLFTPKQVNKQLEIVRNQRMKNIKWFIITEITEPFTEIKEEIIIIEKTKNDEFNVIDFVYVKNENINTNNINKKNIRYKRINKKINAKDKDYEIVQNIEKMETKLCDWAPRIALDGYSYKLEINSLSTKTLMELNEDSFDYGLSSIKTWIDAVISLKNK